MSIWEAALLGLIQGLTEFLPVSSSGHLVLSQHVLGVSAESDGGILFEALVHLGTVLSIVFVYRQEILDLTLGFFREAVRPAGYVKAWESDASFRMAILIAITMIPTGITYLIFKDSIEAAFTDPRFTSGMLLITGLLLLLTKLKKAPSGNISGLKAFFVGVAQSFAMLPGISRSGATICAGIFQNVDPEKATNFSFLMLLPVVSIGTILEVAQAVNNDIHLVWAPMILGLIVSFVSGIAAIKLVLDFVRKGRLEYFAVYCFLVGGIGLVLL